MRQQHRAFAAHCKRLPLYVRWFGTLRTFGMRGRILWLTSTCVVRWRGKHLNSTLLATAVFDCRLSTRDGVAVYLCVYGDKRIHRAAALAAYACGAILNKQSRVTVRLRIVRFACDILRTRVVLAGAPYAFCTDRLGSEQTRTTFCIFSAAHGAAKSYQRAFFCALWYGFASDWRWLLFAITADCWFAARHLLCSAVRIVPRLLADGQPLLCADTSCLAHGVINTTDCARTYVRGKVIAAAGAKSCWRRDAVRARGTHIVATCRFTRVKSTR